MADARQQGRIVDLVAVEIEDRQHRAIADRVEKLADMPGGGQRASLGLAITDDRRDDQVGIVKGRPAGMRQDITQFAAFVDGAGRFRGAVAANAAGEGELS